MLEQEPVPDRVISQPNLSEFVFVRMLVAIEILEILDGIEVTILKDHIYFLPYTCVK